jgi:hypothetical protein
MKMQTAGITKSDAISFLIRKVYETNGGDIEAAFDAVIGEGAYAKLRHDVYTGLRVNAA